ncbi:endoribonuclease CG2145-like [Armigeres subalbatus]|uniref:endoribonuclease CG2145-like n=1 Tax=Armigeres subalbatus TaxID=124917 RepID=UPI002ED401BF
MMTSMKLIRLTAIVLLAFAVLTDAQWFGSKKKKEEDPNVALLSYNPVDPDSVPPEQAPTTSTTTSTTTPAPTTTKKKGFFGGLFGGSGKEKEPKTTTTTTTTPKPTTTTPVPTTKKSGGGFFGGLFGGSKKDKTTTEAPTTAKTTAKSAVSVPTSTAKSVGPSVTTAKAVTPVGVPTSTAKPGTPTSPSKDAFPPLPSVPTTAASIPKPPPTPPKPTLSTPKTVEAFPALPAKPGSPTPSPVPSSTVANAWNKPLPNQPPSPSAGGKPGVSFVPTQAPVGGSTAKTTPRYTEGSTATDDELATISEQLFSKENTNLNKHVRVNYQRQTLSSSSVDEAAEPLLSIDERQVFAVPTIEKMRALFNNYEVDTMVNEHVTPMEKKEENDFVDALLATNVMRTAMLFLQKKGVVTADPKTHHDLLKTIWFQLYSRGNGKIGSSGFEHVFLNEVSNGTMIGLHNWLYLYDQEKAGRLDYQGYIKKMDLGSKGEIAKVRLTFDKLTKPSNSLFIATSPELEIALYTVCFQLRPDTECPLAVNGKKFTIKTFTFRYRGKNLIGGAWPNF